MWNYKTPGIPDEFFERTEKVPITKEEVRVVQLSKGRLNPGYVVYDIGCGSGSISIEASIQVENSGKVFAIDYDPIAVDLTKKNINKFGIKNISVIHGNAKEKIKDLEQANVIFIGGTGGDTSEIINLCQSKLITGGRIVVATILIETLFAVLKIFEQSEFESVDITQVTISKSRKTTKGSMMISRNPVTIISATKS